MNEHDIAEQAYKNGYEAGKRDAVKHGRKAESTISKTGLMCTACHSDIGHDAVFCKYCGAKLMPESAKGEHQCE